MPRSINDETTQELRDFFEVLITSLQEYLGKKLGLKVGRLVIRIMCEMLGGLRLTWPSIIDLEREDRDRKIVTSYKGNAMETALMSGVSPQTVRRVINNWRTSSNKNKNIFPC